jgi:hypothetical protein
MYDGLLIVVGGFSNIQSRFLASVSDEKCRMIMAVKKAKI